MTRYLIVFLAGSSVSSHDQASTACMTPTTTGPTKTPRHERNRPPNDVGDDEQKRKLRPFRSTEPSAHSEYMPTKVVPKARARLARPAASAVQPRPRRVRAPARRRPAPPRRNINAVDDAANGTPGGRRSDPRRGLPRATGTMPSATPQIACPGKKTTPLPRAPAASRTPEPAQFGHCHVSSSKQHSCHQ